VDDPVGSLRPGTATPARSRVEPERSPQPPVATTPDTRLSFPDFYRKHTPSLVAFVMWLGARAEEAADVAQETMTRAYKDWEEIEHPRAWVRTVASREYCRRIAACHDEPFAEIPGQLLRPGMADTDEAAMLGPEQARVLEVLRLLPDRQRQVMAWIYDGYTPAEIATILNLDGGTVRASLHKARDTLKHHMAEKGGQSQ
jgi:RNA polymerase sigma factor (sigma-70 family)